jgi:uracil-DNA glycosylase
MSFSLEEVDPTWRPFFADHIDSIDEILASLEDVEISPAREDIFRAFTFPLDKIRVLILGQDPYPGTGVADGLAFSSPQAPIPASLRNIYKEYSEDLALPIPKSADLTLWAQRGVLLLNRTLTTSVGERNAHLAKGWSAITLSIAQLLADRGVVAILWGNNARELAPLFKYRVESAHPSPLSARRGFFGSKPFSTANELLMESGQVPINWEL